MAETRELQEKLNGQVALNEGCEDQLKLCGAHLCEMGRHQKRTDSKLEELEGKHAEHLRLRGEWAAEVALLREGKAQAETELQECREREAAARQAAEETTAALEEQAGDVAALDALQAALRRELTEVEARYFGLAVELKNQDADIRRTKRACLDKYRDLLKGGCSDGLPGLPRTPKEATLPRSEVAKDECTPLGTAPASLVASLSGAFASPLHSEEGGGKAQTTKSEGGTGSPGAADSAGGVGGGGDSDAGLGFHAEAEATPAEPRKIKRKCWKCRNGKFPLKGRLSVPSQVPQDPAAPEVPGDPVPPQVPQDPTPPQVPQDPSEQGAQRASTPSKV